MVPCVLRRERFEDVQVDRETHILNCVCGPNRVQGAGRGQEKVSRGGTVSRTRLLSLPRRAAGQARRRPATDPDPETGVLGMGARAGR